MGYSEAGRMFFKRQTTNTANRQRSRSDNSQVAASSKVRGEHLATRRELKGPGSTGMETTRHAKGDLFDIESQAPASSTSTSETRVCTIREGNRQAALVEYRRALVRTATSPS